MPLLILTCRAGAYDGAVWDLGEPDRVRIGRRPDNDLVFDTETNLLVSAYHAEVIRDGARYLLYDLGSSNGTRVGGSLLEGPVVLSEGLRVELGAGGPVLEVHLHHPKPLDPKGDSEEHERLPPPTGYVPSGRTQYYQALMHQTARKQSRPLRWTVLGLALLLIGVVVAAYFLLRDRDADTAQLRAQLASAQAERDRVEAKTRTLAERLETTRAALNKQVDHSRTRLADASAKLTELHLEMRKADSEARTKLEVQAKQLEHSKRRYESELLRQSDELTNLKQASQRIASTYRDAVFMLVGRDARGESGFCTAFTVDRLAGVLASNGHCVRTIAEVYQRGGKAIARMNGQPEKSYFITSWNTHRAYRDSAFSPDVALIRVDLGGATLPVQVELGDEQTAQALEPGQAIYTMGFPGRVMNPKRPQADFRAAVISRLTTYDERAPARGHEARMVWHSALTSKGTSGSPIFDVSGKVVAVNNGTLTARRTVVKDPATGRYSEDWIYDATGLNFGVRVDALLEVERP